MLCWWFSNYAGEEWTTVFSLPKEESLHNMGQVRKQEGLETVKYRLTKALKLVPTIFNANIQASQCRLSSHVISSVTVPRRSSRKRIYQDGYYQSFMNFDLINKLSGI